MAYQPAPTTSRTYEVREVLNAKREICFQIYKNGRGISQLYRTRGLAVMAKNELEKHSF